MPSRPFGEIAVKTSMFEMPVVKYAVLTSPHGMPTASFSPPPKSIRRVCEPSSTATILPSRRTREPPPTDSIDVFAVPLLSPELPSKPSVRCVASGSASFSFAATLSVGTTSKPTPGHSTTLRAMRLLIDAMRQLEHIDLTGDVQIVNMRREAALHHRACRGGERTRAVQDRDHCRRASTPAQCDRRDRKWRSGNRARPRACSISLSRTSGEHRPHAARDGLARDQLAGVSIGAVEKPGSAN